LREREILNCLFSEEGGEEDGESQEESRKESGEKEIRKSGTSLAGDIILCPLPKLINSNKILLFYI
jgi:hypothetical protein